MPFEDKFDIEPPIHIGQIATSYPAVHRESGVKVLLKVIHPQWSADKELLQRFQREGRTLMRLNHPNVVKVFEQDQADGIPFIALDWIEGGTLTDKLRHGPLQQREIKSIALDLLNGLEAVHKAGLVHRDLKPDNVLFDPDGTAKLADFSLAGYGGRSELTEHGAAVGSPAYMAPELLDGRHATGRSDLYALGLVLFEALTGSNPYQADDPMLSLDRIRRISPLKLSGRAKLDPNLAGLVDALLKRNPADRPVNAAEAHRILTGDARRQPLMPRRAVLYWSGLALWSLVVLYVISVAGSLGKFETGKARFFTPVQPVMADTDAENKEETDVLMNLLKPIETTAGDMEVALVDPGKLYPAKGSVHILVKPWAKVFVDGDDYGTTPMARIELPAGEYVVRLINDMFPAVSRVISIEPGSRETVSVDLRAEAGRLDISAEPWGYLWVGNDSIGILPRNNPVWLKSGTHRLRISNPAFESFEDSLTVEQGQQYSLHVDLRSGTMIAN